MSQITCKEDDKKAYGLVTAAYNEEDYIEKTILSVVRQTMLPKKWVIVSDGSTDRTEEIVRRYAQQYEFIELHRITDEHPRNLTAQVNAINTGFARLQAVRCDFIGNLDADISFEPTYFDQLLARFVKNPTLGLGGGFIYEQEGDEFRNRRSNNASSVAHAVQLFRRECLKMLGGYRAFSWAGADWYAEVSLRMKGWCVQSFPDLHVFHHRPTGKGFGLLRYWYRGGVMDYYIGAHPLFEVFRLARRCRSKPYFLGALIRLMAFAGAYCRGEERQVPDDFICFLRKEQMERLLAYFHWQSAARTNDRCAETGPSGR
jgi:glycosyltransferase involved in cell wall biosynthesis